MITIKVFEIIEQHLFVRYDMKVEKQKEATAMKKTGRETILAVDDEELVLELIVEMLERIGFTVFKATKGIEAVRIYRENKDEIDLVILDMKMPDIGVGEIFDAIKAMNSNAKILLSSGYDGINCQVKALLESGCSGFIQKPYNLKDLSQKISVILNEK